MINMSSTNFNEGHACVTCFLGQEGKIKEMGILKAQRARR